MVLRIATSTYYEAAARQPSRRALRDADLKVEIARVRAANYDVYGPRKIWLQLNREGVPVARCTVERLMKDLQLHGVRRGRRVVTTRPDARAARPADLVQRKFRPVAPDRLWVADFTYVSTWSGMVYVAFVIDAYARRILGRRASPRCALSCAMRSSRRSGPGTATASPTCRAHASRQRDRKADQLVVATPDHGGADGQASRLN
jgi:putative transposase